MEHFETMQMKQSRLFPKELSRYVIMMGVAVFCCIGFGGCASIRSRNPVDKLPDRSGAILSGQMDGGAVHNILGKPLIASRYWGVELFRDESSQIEVPIVMLIPFAMIKDDIYRYTLVSYDKDQVVTSVASGIHRRVGWLRIWPPIEHNNLILYLQAGDFTFVNQWWDGYDTLLVTPTRRDVDLEQARISSQCNAVIGCRDEALCPEKLRVDEGPTLPMAFSLSVWDFPDAKFPEKTYKNMTALSLEPGSHTLKTWEGRFFLHGEQSITFSCRAGEILSVVIDVSAKERILLGVHVEWKIDLQNEVPEFFADRYLLLYRGEQWLVNPEPRN